MYSIIADEVTIHGHQYLTVGLRYLETRPGQEEVREEWLGYQAMEDCDSESIYKLIRKELQEVGIPIEHAVGTAFDGARYS